jgi:transposase
MMKERKKGKTQDQAAAKANILSRKTVKKYEGLGKLPSELRQPRAHRTRSDPFEADWAEVEKKLKDAPELEAKTLFEWLREQGRTYQDGQLRTLQRRVSAWRALNCSQVLSLDQVRRPGEVLQTDGTWMNDLKISIQRQPFEHLLIHSVLPYSNWEWGRVAQSESLLAIRLGLQSALVKLGYLPQAHQTDHSSAATHVINPASGRGFNDEYLQLLEHYGIEPRVTHVRSPNENGDVESSNGGLKRAVEQHLLLRGSRNFESLEEYESFLFGIMEKRNAGRKEKLAEELTAMKPLEVTPWPPMRELLVRVGANGMIRVGANGYTVPSGLKGKRVNARVFEWKIEVWFANQLVETLPKLTGVQHYCVNYRHVIDTLLRKPGGFRDYRYRDDLFPQEVFRQTWEKLNALFPPRKADLLYLRILKQAARGMESDVAQSLTALLASSTTWTENVIVALTQPLASSSALPEIHPQTVNLFAYDQLLTETQHVRA